MSRLSHHQRHKAVWLIAVLWGAMCLFTGQPSLAAGQAPTEYQVKAAFLFNFAKFIDWPAARFSREDAPLVIGVLGKDPFGPILDAIIHDKSINRHPLQVQRLADGDDLKACHVLFVSRSEKQHLGEIVEAVKGSAVLTVGETDDFLQRGGMINLYLESDSVKFAINPASAQRAGLGMSSKLLGVAKVVNVEPGQ
jgi:YfiR/HmsC-like